MEAVENYIVRHPVVFWVLAVVVTSAPAQIPLIGTGLWIALLVAAGVWRHQAKQRRPEALDELLQTRSARKAAKAGTAISPLAMGRLEVYAPAWGEDRGRRTLYVMDKCHKEVRSLIATQYAPSRPPRDQILLVGTAAITPEPTNTYDSDAVLATVGGTRIGYFSLEAQDAALDLFRQGGGHMLCTSILVSSTPSETRAWVFSSAAEARGFSDWLAQNTGGPVFLVGPEGIRAGGVTR